MREQFDLFINGKWLSTDNTVDVLNKYTGETYATVSEAGEKEVDQAIDSAEKAYKSNKLGAYNRYKILKELPKEVSLFKRVKGEDQR